MPLGRSYAPTVTYRYNVGREVMLGGYISELALDMQKVALVARQMSRWFYSPLQSTIGVSLGLFSKGVRGCPRASCLARAPRPR